MVRGRKTERQKEDVLSLSCSKQSGGRDDGYIFGINTLIKQLESIAKA
jgi:hypothetical protein